MYLFDKFVVKNRNCIFVLIKIFFLHYYTKNYYIKFFGYTMFEEKLIEEVRKNACIYDKREVSYRNKFIKAKAWNTIAKNVGRSGKTILLRFDFPITNNTFIIDLNRTGMQAKVEKPTGQVCERESEEKQTFRQCSNRG